VTGVVRVASVPAAELERLRDIETETRGLLAALRAEQEPTAHLRESIITQHHMDRLAELLDRQDKE
jgi:hypothetical protein